MAPNNITVEKLRSDDEQDELLEKKNNDKTGEEEEFKPQIIWINTISIILIHVLAVYSFLAYWTTIMFETFMWELAMGGICGFGVTAGAHRLWAHRSYKAKWPLKVILLMCFSAAGQNTVFDWVRDHRVHHKYSETDADPHNSNRGFFFAHVGWLMQKKHKQVLLKGKQLDMSDITDDPLIAFHHKYFTILKIIFCFVIPTIVPPLLWGETWKISFLACIVRYVLSLNFTWSVNSAAHLYGNRPYDTRINPRENLAVSIVALGEGWHNYHHVFPWDYKAAELGDHYNLTTFWLDLFAKIGWAYDLKQPSRELIRKVALRHGDGSYPDHQEVEYEDVMSGKFD